MSKRHICKASFMFITIFLDIYQKSPGDKTLLAFILSQAS